MQGAVRAVLGVWSHPRASLHLYSGLPGSSRGCEAMQALGHGSRGASGSPSQLPDPALGQAGQSEGWRPSSEGQGVGQGAPCHRGEANMHLLADSSVLSGLRGTVLLCRPVPVLWLWWRPGAGAGAGPGAGWAHSCS